MTDSLQTFYDNITPFYHLIYPDWNASITRQAAMLHTVIQDHWGPNITELLDVSCGIGTQSLGLAALGYQVTASDLSPHEVDRATREAQQRGLSIAFSAADMRKAHTHHNRTFDVVLSCDNAVPHLMTDDDIRTAFQQMHACTRPGGGCIISVRDYDAEDVTQPQTKAYGIREEDGIRWVLFQTWEPQGATYNLTLYFIEDNGQTECRTHALRSTYNNVGIPRYMELMGEAGIINVARLDGSFFQPLVIGTRV